MPKNLKEIIISTILGGALVVLPACSNTTKTVKNNLPKCQADAVDIGDVLKQSEANSTLEYISQKFDKNSVDAEFMDCFTSELRRILGSRYTVGYSSDDKYWTYEVTLKTK